MGRRQLMVGSWNLRFGAGRPELVAGLGLDLLLLQEATPAAFEAFRPLFDDGRHAIDPTLCSADQLPRHGVAVLWSDRLAFRGASLGEHMVLPHRFLCCDLAFVEQRGYFRACSYHALNGEQGEDGFDKPRVSYQVARWLEDEPRPVIIGMDANSPAVDHPDFDKTVCHFDWLGPRHFERALLGPEARHRQFDVWRRWLEEHPAAMASVVADRPDGPLAVSHRTGRTQDREGNPQRFDHILATEGDFRVVAAAYDYDGGLGAGSDHALVTATLEVGLTAGERHGPDFVLPTAVRA